MRTPSDNRSPAEESNVFASPVEILTTETGLMDATDRNPMIVPRMIQFVERTLPTDLPLQGDQGGAQLEIEYDENDDKPPEIKKIYQARSDTRMYDQIKQYQVEQNNSPNNRFQKRLTSKALRKQRTFFFGIFSKKHGICINLLRFLFAILTIPFLLLAIIFTLIIFMMKKMCCKVRNQEVACCFLCMCQKEAIDTCWDIVQCNCQSAALDCDKKYEALLKIRDKNIDSCISIATKGGENCGDCLESLVDSLVTICVKKCQSWGLCGCNCSCNVDFSGCGDCAGECFGGMIRDCSKCFRKVWGCFCEETICEVVTGACDKITKGTICSCLDLLGSS